MGILFHYLNGEPKESANNRYIEVFERYSVEVYAHTPASNPLDMNEAISTAQVAEMGGKNSNSIFAMW